MTKINSLNLVSITKATSEVLKQEINSNDEVFATNELKSNIDEVVISNQNENTHVEENANNKKKWFIAAGTALGIIAIGVASYFLFKRNNNKFQTVISDNKLLNEIQKQKDSCGIEYGRDFHLKHSAKSNSSRKPRTCAKLN